MRITRLFITAALTCISPLAHHTYGQCSDIPANPVLDTKGAGFGAACVMSADGTIALVSGPGYDLGDGLVRTFEQVDGQWIEGAAITPNFFFGENFGNAISMNDAGTRAVITAPRESAVSPGFTFAAGSVYIYERDAKSGLWSQTQQWYAPVPGVEHNFGASCDISADGNTVVIGQTNILGTEFAGLEDSAFVTTYNNGSWSPLVELQPTSGIPNHFNYGTTIAITDDASLIAVGAPGAMAFTPESGMVVVYENIMGAWTQTDLLNRPTSDSFNSFGGAIAFDGHTLLVVNRSETAKGPNFEPGPPICIYQRSGSAYPANPDELMYQALGAPAPGALVIRGDTMVVGDDGTVIRYTRDTQDPNRSWAFDGAFAPDEIGKFGNSRFGAALAIGNNPEDFVIGEPGWFGPGGFGEGRINFPNRVFTNSDFEINTDFSSMQISFDFPGLPTQTLFIQLLGYFNLSYPESCSGYPIPFQAAIESFELMPNSPEYTLDGPLGTTIRLSEVVISLAAPSDPAPIDASQQGTFTGMTVQVDAMVKVGVLPAFPFSAQGEQSEPMVTQITGGFFDKPLQFSIPQLGLEFEPDLGLGDNNPSITGTGSVSSTGPTPMVCLADLNNDDQLDFIDIQAFIEAYTNLDPLADLNDDFQYDFIDIQAFLASYNSGCP